MTVSYTVGDTREVIATIPDGSVDLIASSPPFLALRSYVPADHASKGDEIGSEANPAAFIDMLLGLTAEWGRVLAPHGSIAIELGDTYSGSGGAGGDYNPGGLREGQDKFEGTGYVARQDTKTRKVKRDDHAGGIANLHGKKQPGGTGWPRAKSLALIPQLYAVALAYGINPLTGQPSPAGRWLVRNVIVWHRPNPAVGALGDKVRPSTSYIVIATRSAKRWFDLTAVRSSNTLNLQPRNGMKAASNPARNDADEGYGDNPAGAPPLDTWFDQYDGSHDTWTLTTQPSRLAHYAMWPAKLAERLILMMCPREVCLVCGEPRRRIEGKSDRYAELRAGATTLDSSDWDALSSPGGRRTRNGLANERWEGGGTFTAAEYETLGWTDCGDGPGQTHCPIYRPGVVLDPFAGSGTTLAVADLHGRDAIGVDFDARNKAIYPARYDEVKRALYGTPAPMPGQMELAL